MVIPAPGDALTIEDAGAHVEAWPLRTPFVIARGTTTEIDLVVVELSDGAHRGSGECCPVARYGETTESVCRDATAMVERLRAGESWDSIHDSVPAGAARNAVDCAHWDLVSRRLGRPAWNILGIEEPRAVDTVMTIGLDEPSAMAASAVAANKNGFLVLKLKLGSQGDIARVEAVRESVPDARLIVDVNEGWDGSRLEEHLGAMARLGVEMVEQPLPVDADGVLDSIDRPVPVGADESCHTTADLERIASRYDLINIKLDKSGGLTEAMRMLRAAPGFGLDCMVGCMLGTSLAMAPGLLVAQRCRYVDLDAPLLIGRDRDPALEYRNGRILPAAAGFWGGGNVIAA